MKMRLSTRFACVAVMLCSIPLAVDARTRIGVSLGYPLGDWGYVGYSVGGWSPGHDYWHGPTFGIHHGWRRHGGWYDPWWGWNASARWRYEPVTVVEVEPLPPPTPVEEAWQALSAGQIETAAQRFTEVDADPESSVGELASAELGAGLAKLASGDLSGAVEWLRSALIREPGVLQRAPISRALQPQLERLKESLVYGWPAGLTLDEAQFLRAVLFATTGDLASARHVAHASLGQSAEWIALRSL